MSRQSVSTTPDTCRAPKGRKRLSVGRELREVVKAWRKAAV